MAQEINSQNFETLLASGKPVVVDFWATWCGPCQMVGPLIEELAQEYDGRVIVGKCDVDQDSDLPAQFNVRNIPTILFFKDGQLAKKLVGAQSKEVLKSAVEELL